MQFTVSVLIEAEPTRVFDILSDVQRSPDVLPNVSNVEVLSDGSSLDGLRWKETRRMMGRDATVELEVLSSNRPTKMEVATMVLNTAYHSVFTLTAASGGTHLAHDFESTGGGFLAGLVDKLAEGTMKLSMQADLDAIKTYCEATGER